MNITLEQAEKAVTAAKAKAIELGTKMNISVVDAGANILAFAQMNGAWLGSADISLKKAKTARFFDMNTGVVGSLSQPGGHDMKRPPMRCQCKCITLCPPSFPVLTTTRKPDSSTPMSAAIFGNESMT